MTFQQIYKAITEKRLDSNEEILDFLRRVSQPIGDEVFKNCHDTFCGSMKKVFVNGDVVIKVFNTDDYAKNHYFKNFLFSEMTLNDIFEDAYDTKFIAIQLVQGQPSFVTSQPFKKNVSESSKKIDMDVFLSKFGFQKVIPSLEDISKYFNARKDNIQLKKFQLEVILDVAKNGIYIDKVRKIALDDTNESNFTVCNDKVFLYDANVFDLSEMDLTNGI